MTKIGGIFGALLGAGGATAYFSGPESNSFMGQMLRSTFGGNSFGAGTSHPSNSPELDSLYKLVESLRRDMHRSGGSGVTIVHGSNGSSAIVTYGGVILVTAAGWAYFRGWKFSDLLYVTRSSMQKSLATVNSSVEGMKNFLGQQVENIRKRQEESREAQERLKKKLEDVGSRVEATGSDVKEVHSDLSKLGSGMEDLKLQQGYTAEGIYVLCSVVGDLMKSVNPHQGKQQSTIELEQYLSRPQIRQMQGLEGLLGGQAAPSPQLGYVAPRRALSALPPFKASIPEDTMPSPDSEHTGPLRREEHSRGFSAFNTWPRGSIFGSNIKRAGSGIV